MGWGVVGCRGAVGDISSVGVSGLKRVRVRLGGGGVGVE